MQMEIFILQQEMRMMTVTFQRSSQCYSKQGESVVKLAPNARIILQPF